MSHNLTQTPKVFISYSWDSDKHKHDVCNLSDTLRAHGIDCHIGQYGDRKVSNQGLTLMQCPECQSTHINKNGKKKGKQNYRCVNCHRQFIDNYQPNRGYPDEVRRDCLTMYINGMGFRAIERVKGIHHTTVINWVKQVGELDELETFVGSKSGATPLIFNQQGNAHQDKTKFGSGQ